MVASSMMPTDPDILIIAASETNSNLYYATRFLAPDPFIFLRIKGERILIMSDLEVDRARATATVDAVLSYSEYEERLKRRGVMSPGAVRSEDHTSELQSRQYLVCRLLLEKK